MPTCWLEDFQRCWVHKTANVLNKLPKRIRRQIASYVGITPMPYQSGGMDRDRRISRAGNPRARTTIIQLAWLWLRYQPASDLAEWFRERVGTLAGRTRRIAIVAMARKLLIALWRYIETGLIPAGVEIRMASVAAV